MNPDAAALLIELRELEARLAEIEYTPDDWITDLRLWWQTQAILRRRIHDLRSELGEAA